MKKYLLLAMVIGLTACQQTQNHAPTTLAAPVPVPVVQTTPSIPFEMINDMAAVRLEIADTPTKREHGLMNRTHLPENEGMLFTLDTPSTPCFWMKNTLIPLSVGFLNEQGVLVQVEDMQPNTTDIHCAKTPIKYAIEMNQGWFKNHKVPLGRALLKTHP